MESAESPAWNRYKSLLETAPLNLTSPAAISTPLTASLTRSSSLLFVDSRVQDYQSLLAGVRSGTEIHVLDSTDAIAQITQTLTGRSNISSLHILSYGSAGNVELGNDWVDLSDLDRHANQLQSWASALTEDADILLYGCDVAEGAIGQTFVKQLATLTGADVAASDDLTGNSALGGNWDLEVKTGEIEASLAFSQTALSQYTQTLNIIINEFQRTSGDFTSDEYVELLLTADLTATQLQNLFFGDSSGSTASKFGIYQFGNLSNIATTFKAGTLIVVGGNATSLLTEDTLYNPIAGGTDDQWNLRLRAKDGVFVTGANGNFAGSQDAAWVGNTNAGTESIHSIAYKTTGSYGAFGTAAIIKLDVTNANPVIQFNGNGNQTTDLSKFSFVTSGSIGLANGGNNTTYINSLRNPSAPPTAQPSNVSFNEDNTYSFKSTDFSFSGGSLQAIRITQLATIGQLFLDGNDDNNQDAGEAITVNQTVALADISKLKFKPVTNANGNSYADFKFKVSNGQFFSASDATMTLSVNSVNDAPTLDTSGSPALPSLAQGVSNPAGMRVTDLIASLGGTGITDLDRGAIRGIAITGADNTNGTWQFSTNGGTNWTNLDLVSDNAATLLGATPLYTPDLGSAIEQQSWLSFNNLRSASGTILPGSSIQSANTNGTLLNTTGDIRNYAGYTNYQVNPDLSQSLKNPGFPALDRVQGYSLSFNLQVLQESHTNSDRGFAVTLLDKNSLGIELGIQFDGTNGRIFAQSLNAQDQFVGAESISFNTNSLTSYMLTVQGDTYQLFANGTQILTGTLRDYRNWTSPDGFPSPYALPNFVFLGDSTTSAQGIFNVGQIAIQTDTRVRFVPNSNYVGNSQISFRGWDTTNGGSNGQTNVNVSSNGGATAFSTAVETATIAITAPPASSPWVNEGSADFDRDGNVDILWRNPTTGENYVWKMSGTNFVSAIALPTESDLNWKIEGIADFDGDSKVDILWRKSSTGENYVWKMDGTNFVSAIALPTEADLNWKITGVGDFDGDSKVDILWRNAATGENYVWKMDGTNFVSAIALPGERDLNWQSVGVGDFDGDGKADILWRNSSTGQNYIWKMDGTNFVSAIALRTESNLNWQVFSVVKFDGDSKVDILWRNTTTGENYVWKMNGIDFDSAIALPVG
jgi:Domain of unknown function (DUF4347)/FG-GAP-like repeat